MFGIKQVLPASAALVILMALSGCGKEGGGAESKAAATINGKSIPAALIDEELKRLGQIPPDQSQNIANRLLRNVMDQELLAQQAEQAKIDSQADVQMKIASMRRQILAEAQIAALTKGVANPAEADIKAYFDGHPELFAQRAIYRLQELIVGSTPETVGDAKQAASQAKTPRELAAALQAKGIPVAAREAVKSAEDLPSDLLGKLSQMKPGQTLTLEQNGKLNMVILVAAEPKPVNYEQASPLIARFLANKKKRELLEAELNKLRTGAKIEYTAPYTALTDNAPAQAKP